MPDFADKRINILNQKEVEEFYGFPRFFDEERMIFFALTPPEQQLVDIHRSMASKVCCILQLGYFKANNLKLINYYKSLQRYADVHHKIVGFFPTSKQTPN